MHPKRENALPTGNESFARGPGKSVREILVRAAIVFLLSCLVLSFTMSLRPKMYDEGFALSAAMRIEAGQIPHRDFYVNYGPAQFYILAGLFKLFGPSLLVERVYDLSIKALVLVLVCAIASSYCRPSVVLGAACLTGLWVFGLLNESCGYVVAPVSLLNLAGTALVLPVIGGGLSKWRMLTVGLIAGLGILFRYDTGLAMFAFDVFVVAVAVYLRFEMTSARVRSFLSVIWPCISGVALVVLPPVIFYLSVAPLHPFFHDVLLFPSKYYVKGRGLPFPRVTLMRFDYLVVYLLLLLEGIAIYFGTMHLRRIRGDIRNVGKLQDWLWFLFAFGFLAFAMYFKGWVRISPLQEYLSIIPCILLLAILVEKQAAFPHVVRASIAGIGILFVSTAAWAGLRELRNLYVEHASVPQRLVSLARGTVPEIRGSWCKNVNPLTRGICFLPEDDRIRAIEFVTSHTNPGQKLFSGLTRHDKIYANDDLIYFATQRLPATRWSHFDPCLQDRYDIQTDIIHELELNAPPYIVKDSEFDQIKEPNASSVSSGVRLLDEYLDNNYEKVGTFGLMSVWQRKPDNLDFRPPVGSPGPDSE